VSLLGYLLAGAGGLLVVAVPWLRSLWDRRQRRKAEARADTQQRRADTAEATVTAGRAVEADRQAGERHEDVVEAAAGKASKHKDRAAARERMKLRGGR
jgi:type II secretory pathway component PulM